MSTSNSSDRQNLYGPDITFVGVPRASVSDLDELNTVGAAILGAPFDGGTSYRSGARLGPRAIRLSDCQLYDGTRPHLALRVDPLQQLNVVDLGDVDMPSFDIDTALARLTTAVSSVAKHGVMPVVLGGDHSIAYANLQGMRSAYEDVAVIHFDAHADTGDLHFGHPFGHGTPMRRAIEAGAVSGSRFFQIGLRGYWPDPDVLAWMSRHQMRAYEMTELRARGLDVVVDEAVAAVRSCDAVFLSIDIDVVDPGFAPGTGTPEPGGLTSWELLSSVRRVCSSVNVRGMEVVEVAPAYDHADVTALLANRVILEALAATSRRHLEDAGGPRWQAERPLLADR